MAQGRVRLEVDPRGEGEDTIALVAVEIELQGSVLERGDLALVHPALRDSARQLSAPRMSAPR